MLKRKCPLSLASTSGFVEPCMREECEWWVEGQCAVAAVARLVRAGILRFGATLLLSVTESARAEEAEV